MPSTDQSPPDQILGKLKELLLSEQEFKIQQLEQKISLLEKTSTHKNEAASLFSTNTQNNSFQLLENQLSERIRQEGSIQQQQLRQLAAQVTHSADTSQTISERSGSKALDLDQSINFRMESLKSELLSQIQEIAQEFKKELILSEERHRSQLAIALQRVAQALQSSPS